MSASPRAIACLLGPTAAGKTAAALALAARWPIEIVSVDSALVYRAMNIGTAKPTLEVRARVPHHLIDLIDPTEHYSAANFRSDAMRSISEIIARGRIPLLVGGTLFYYKALTQGINALPAANTNVREALNAYAKRCGWPALHAWLATLDPQAAARIAPHDAQRTQRALEVFLLSGTTLSALQGVTPQSQANPAYRFVPISLEPATRAVLHARIAQRFDAMLAEGLIAEVEQLRARGNLHANLPSMRCVGYRQTWAYLDGTIDYASLRETGICATRQLCKRQLTWLRTMPERIVIDCCAANATEQVVNTVEAILGSPHKA